MEWKSYRLSVMHYKSISDLDNLDQFVVFIIWFNVITLPYPIMFQWYLDFWANKICIVCILICPQQRETNWNFYRNGNGIRFTFSSLTSPTFLEFCNQCITMKIFNWFPRVVCFSKAFPFDQVLLRQKRQKTSSWLLFIYSFIKIKMQQKTYLAFPFIHNTFNFIFFIINVINIVTITIFNHFYVCCFIYRIQYDLSPSDTQIQLVK